MKKIILFWLIFCLAAISYAKKFDFYPNANYDSAIPTLEQVVGHSWGERITSHGEMVRYIKVLAEASKYVEIMEYGETWEGRKLYYLIIASEENLADRKSVV